MDVVRLAYRSIQLYSGIRPAVQNENVMDMQDTAETASPGEGVFPLPTLWFQQRYRWNKKIIWTVDMEVETLEFDSFLSNLEQEVQRFGGYLESSSVSGSSIQYTSNRYGTVTVRIPSAQLDAFLDQVGKIGTVTYTNKSSEDITLDYVDVESRIEALEVEQERLLALLESAQDLESVIQLESRLSEVRYQLENYRSTQNRYDSLIDYSTVSLSIQEVQRVTTVHDQSVGQRIAAGWSDTLYRLKNGVWTFCMVCRQSAVFADLGGFGGVVVWLCLRHRKKRRKRRFYRTEMSPEKIPGIRRKKKNSHCFHLRLADSR